MLILGSIVILLIGIFTFFCPGVIYERTEQWKSPLCRAIGLI